MALIAIFANLITAVLGHPIPIHRPGELAGLPLAPGAFGHLLGTDEIGRRFAGAVDLRRADLADGGALRGDHEITIGTVLGAISGYYGGWVDFVISLSPTSCSRSRCCRCCWSLTPSSREPRTSVAEFPGDRGVIGGCRGRPSRAWSVRRFSRCASASSPKPPGRSAIATGASSSGTCCPTRSRRSSCRRRSKSPTSSSSSRCSPFLGFGSSRRPRRGENMLANAQVEHHRGAVGGDLPRIVHPRHRPGDQLPRRRPPRRARIRTWSDRPRYVLDRGGAAFEHTCCGVDHGRDSERDRRVGDAPRDRAQQ